MIRYLLAGWPECTSGVLDLCSSADGKGIPTGKEYLHSLYCSYPRRVVSWQLVAMHQGCEKVMYTSAPMFVGTTHYNTATCVGRRTAAKPFNVQRVSCFAELVLGDPVMRSANKGLKDNIPCPLQRMRQYPLSLFKC